jgi:uracil-DNA glycosylase family 4
VTGPKLSPGQLASYLRQQGELMGPELFLDSLTGADALRLSLERHSTHLPASSIAPIPAVSGTDQRPLSPDYDGLLNQALSCQKCGLAGTRNKVVFSDGNPTARLMVVGEAPGAQEDKTGKAFVGPAGKLLDLLLASVGLSRATSVYICNVLKCRPPGNRNPLPGEIKACTPFLKRQIELISPQAILAVGTFAAQFLTTRESPLGRLRGEVFSYHGVPLVVTYHPAALLRNSGWTRATWDDLQLLRQVIDEA